MRAWNVFLGRVQIVDGFSLRNTISTRDLFRTVFIASFVLFIAVRSTCGRHLMSANALCFKQRVQKGRKEKFHFSPDGRRIHYGASGVRKSLLNDTDSAVCRVHQPFLQMTFTLTALTTRAWINHQKRKLRWLPVLSRQGVRRADVRGGDGRGLTSGNGGDETGWRGGGETKLKNAENYSTLADYNFASLFATRPAHDRQLHIISIGSHLACSPRFWSENVYI